VQSTKIYQFSLATNEMVRYFFLSSVTVLWLVADFFGLFAIVTFLSMPREGEESLDLAWVQIGAMLGQSSPGSQLNRRES